MAGEFRLSGPEFDPGPPMWWGLVPSRHRKAAKPSSRDRLQRRMGFPRRGPFRLPVDFID